MIVARVIFIFFVLTCGLENQIDASKVKIAELGLAAIVNVKSFDSHEAFSLFRETDLIDSLDFQHANTILFDAGFFSKIADGFSNKSGSDFDRGCGVVEGHWIVLVDGESVS